MGISGPNFPSTMTQQAGTGPTWASTSATTGPNNGVGNIPSGDNATTRKLRTGPDGLGFAIPAGATVTGILVTVWAKGGFAV